MAFLSSMNIIGSGMTAQQVRLDVISENISNMQTTRTEQGGAYRRKMTVFQAESGKNSFRLALDRAAVRRGISISNRNAQKAGGVRVTEIREDESELPIVYDPTHPDANEQGYVEMPNVILVREVTDAMAASQAFSANATALGVLRTVAAKGLEIGK